jgi:hypothetical protein
MKTAAPYVLAALLATPALPCSPAIDDLSTAGLIEDGETDVPTRVHLAFSRFGIPGTVLVVEADAAAGTPPVASLSLAGTGLVGLVELEPARRYEVVAEDGLGSVSFTTGAGEDTVPPAAPDVELDVIQRGPELLPFDSCSGGGVAGGSTRVDVLVAGDADVAGVLAKDPDTGAVVGLGKDSITFVDEDAGARLVEIVAVDRAGNESVPVPVTIDFGGPGGCSQGTAAPPAAALLALVGRLGTRRRRR